MGNEHKNAARLFRGPNAENAGLESQPKRKPWIWVVARGELVQCLRMLGYDAYGCESQRPHKLIAIGATVNLKLGANWALVPLMGVSGIIAGTAVMCMVSFALLWWFSVSFTKQRSAP